LFGPGQSGVPNFADSEKPSEWIMRFYVSFKTVFVNKAFQICE
jgi:hypothetical protein